jgi:hypothetical protein
MTKILALIAVCLLIVGGITGVVVAYANDDESQNETPQDVLSVAELLENSIYDTEFTVQGTVGSLGEVFCPCFELSSGGETIWVWYDLMVDDDGTERPSVSVEGIENGDQVVVTGELRSSDGQLPSRTFWASSIELMEVTINLAPIHEVQVNIAESYPPQIFVYIKGGLSDGCTTLYEITEERDGNTINIEITTKRPKDKACAEVYSYFEKKINLGTDFVSGETYTIYVNDTTTSFVMQ